MGNTYGKIAEGESTARYGRIMEPCCKLEASCGKAVGVMNWDQVIEWLFEVELVTSYGRLWGIVNGEQVVRVERQEGEECTVAVRGQQRSGFYRNKKTPSPPYAFKGRRILVEEILIKVQEVGGNGGKALES